MPALPGQPTRSSTALARLPELAAVRRHPHERRLARQRQRDGRSRPGRRRLPPAARRPSARRSCGNADAPPGPLRAPGHVGQGAVRRRMPPRHGPLLPGSGAPSTAASAPGHHRRALPRRAAPRSAICIEHALRRRILLAAHDASPPAPRSPRSRCGDSAATPQTRSRTAASLTGNRRSAPRRRRSDRRHCARAAGHRRVARVACASRRASPRAAGAPPSPDRSTCASTALLHRRVALRQPALRQPQRPTSARRATSPPAPCITSAGVSRSIPSSVHSACSRVRGSGALDASVGQRRHDGRVLALDQQPLRRVAPPAVRVRQRLHQASRTRRPTSPASDRGASCRGRRGRCGRSRSAARAVRDDVIAQVLGDEAAVLDDAAIHVDDVERAVGRVRQIHRPEALVGRRQELRRVVRLLRLERRAVVAQRRSG